MKEIFSTPWTRWMNCGSDVEAFLYAGLVVWGLLPQEPGDSHVVSVEIRRADGELEVLRAKEDDGMGRAFGRLLAKKLFRVGLPVQMRFVVTDGGE